MFFISFGNFKNEAYSKAKNFMQQFYHIHYIKCDSVKKGIFRDVFLIFQM